VKRLLAVGLFLAAAVAQVYWPTGRGLLVGRDEGGVARFLGLPYARAGRFQRPRLLPLPKGTFDARRPGPACPQRGSIEVRLGAPLPPQSEDCLNLNLWVPESPPPEGGFPVMVYLHGGSFTGGSGASPIYDGAALARRGVIVVTLNYRLGALGFLALPGLAKEDPDGSTGNYGLLDQIAALRWVRRHIRAFGGNPERVTLFGESAGAMSACALLTSPLAKGLFSRVILQSGGCDQARSLEAGYRAAERIGRRLGCDPADLACWRRLPVERYLTLLDRIDPLADFEKAPFKPHLDGYVLKLPPEEALRRGAGADVPLIAGANAEEFALNLALYAVGPRTWADFARLAAERGVDPKRALAVYRRRFADPLAAFFAFETERVLLCPTYRAARLHRGATHAYLFAYRSATWPFAGAFHGLDVAFVFDTFTVWPFWGVFVSAPEFAAAEATGRLMRRYWTAFAKGTPLRAGLMPWPDYRSGWVLRFGKKSGWTRDPFPRRCRLFVE